MGHGAEFNDNRTHRYRLWRIWDDRLPKVMFIGLNPSNANEMEDDPTIRRVIGYAQNWGYGGVYMVNLFTVISSDPDILKNPIQWGNWAHARGIILDTAAKCDKVIFAWGNHKAASFRAYQIAGDIIKPHCLSINKNGSPKHPLYCKSDLKPIVWEKK